MSHCIGERIRIIRGERSRPGFARRFGIHPNTLANYERAERRPDSGFLAALCLQEKVDPRWLLLGPESASPPCPEQAPAGSAAAYDRRALEQVGRALGRHLLPRSGSRTGQLLVTAYEHALVAQSPEEIDAYLLDLLALLQVPPAGALGAEPQTTGGET